MQLCGDHKPSGLKHILGHVIEKRFPVIIHQGVEKGEIISTIYTHQGVVHCAGVWTEEVFLKAWEKYVNWCLGKN